MSFSLSSGRILIDKDSVTRLDTNDEMAHNLTTGINATLNIAAQTATTSASVGFTTDHSVGTCNAACTEVQGAMRITYATPSSGPQNFTVPSTLWFTVKLGATVWLFMDGERGGPFAGANYSPLQYCHYTLIKSGSNISLRQQIRLPTVAGGTYTMIAHTIDLKLKAGLFT